MLTQHIALVPELAEVSPGELARVSAALQKQVTRDLAPIWGISATVDAFPRLEDVPIGYWPIIVTLRDLGNDAGIHIDKHGQPFALVELSPSWSLAASHECLQMLVNPFGNRTIVAKSPRDDQWQVEFLVQLCDPCGDARYAYTVNDVLVSEFCTPAYFERDGAVFPHYSFIGAVQEPFQVLPGGYLCWYDPVRDAWWMRSYFADTLTDTNLGDINCKMGAMREVINALAPGRLQATRMSIEAFEERMGIARQRAMFASQHRAHRLRTSEMNFGRALGGASAPTSLYLGGVPGPSGERFEQPRPAVDPGQNAPLQAQHLQAQMDGSRVDGPESPLLPGIGVRISSPRVSEQTQRSSSRRSPIPPPPMPIPFASTLPFGPAATSPSVPPSVNTVAPGPQPSSSKRTVAIAAVVAVGLLGVAEIYRALPPAAAPAATPAAAPAPTAPSAATGPAAPGTAAPGAAPPAPAATAIGTADPTITLPSVRLTRGASEPAAVETSPASSAPTTPAAPMRISSPRPALPPVSRPAPAVRAREPAPPPPAAPASRPPDPPAADVVVDDLIGERK